MPSRHRARERSLQILFEWDARKEPIEDAIAAFYDSLYSEQSETKPERDEFVDRLVKGVAENITEIDRRRVTFEFTVTDPIEPCGRGKHVRFVVETAKSRERLAAKRAKAGLK